MAAASPSVIIPENIVFSCKYRSFLRAICIPLPENGVSGREQGTLRKAKGFGSVLCFLVCRKNIVIPVIANVLRLPLLQHQTGTIFIKILASSLAARYVRLSAPSFCRVVLHDHRLFSDGRCAVITFCLHKVRWHRVIRTRLIDFLQGNDRQGLAI